MIGKKILPWVAVLTMVLLLIVVAGSVQAKGGPDTARRTGEEPVL